MEEYLPTYFFAQRRAFRLLLRATCLRYALSLLMTQLGQFVETLRLRLAFSPVRWPCFPPCCPDPSQSALRLLHRLLSLFLSFS